MAAIQRLNTPPKLHVEEYPLVIRLADLPQDAAIKVGSLPLRGEGSEGDADFVLKVSKPAEIQAPAIPAALNGWLKPGFDKPQGELKHFERRKITSKDGSSSQVKFADDAARPAAFAKYEKVRNDWVAQVKKGEAASKLFEQLLETWGRLERESERIHLVFGDAVMHQVTPKLTVEHPLVTQELSIDFDPEIPEFTLREGDANPEIYTELLHWAQVENDTIRQARKWLQNAEGENRLKELVQFLWPDSPLLDKPEDMTMPELAPGPQLVTDPIIYLGFRTQGFMQAIETFLEAVPTMGELPPSLVRVVGLEPQAEDSPPPADILYTMPANPEQERVAVRLARSGSVLVQGPPGTGKTHTIANLIGHLLAQGKSILVTSQRTKALRVLRDMIIPELRPLCVSVLDHETESKSQLEEAVKGMVARFSSSEAEELDQLAETYRLRRLKIKDQLGEAEQRLIDARLDEYRPLKIGSEEVHPTVAAQKVAEGRGTLDWIPGPLAEGAPLPLNPDELNQLYSQSAKVSSDVRPDASTGLLPVEDLLAAGQLNEILSTQAQLATKANRFAESFWVNPNQDHAQLEKLRHIARQAAVGLRNRDTWLLECTQAGLMGGAHRQGWEDFVRLIEQTHQEIAPLERAVLTIGPKLESDLPLNVQLEAAQEMIAHLKADKSIGYLQLLTKPAWKKLLEHSRVDGGAPRTLEHLDGIVSLIKVRQKRDMLRSRWERQITQRGGIKPAELGDRPEDTALQYVERIRRALSWSMTTWPAALHTMREVGVSWEHVIEQVPPTSAAQGEITRIRQALEEQLEPLIESRMAMLEHREHETKLRNLIGLLTQHAGPTDSGRIAEELKQAVLARDVERYAQAVHQLVALHQQTVHAGRRDELLARLAEAAPNWAGFIRERIAPHDGDKPPGDAEEAWFYRQCADMLTARQQRDIDELQQEVVRLRDKLRDTTAKYVENLTWSAQLRRTGVRQQQALIGWLDLMRKIGSGKGKRAPQLKAKARERLAECQESVPVWIMPLSRVAESYHPGKALFDVVILDEASQSDIMGLIAFALGKEVVVVGDHEQVSPDAVGQSYAEIEELIETHLQDIPNKELYDGKTSVYDLARQSFGGTIRLLEHFRSVPEIIAFSNALCYEGEIQPLRESSAVKVRPACVAHRVSGTVERKINQREVQEIASLILAACEQPEYAQHSFGVISLVGEDQAVAIDKLLTQHMDLPQYQARKIVCGTAPQFQGDERDIMFLSVVDAPSDIGTLPLRNDERFIKRFNVAASRARDQMWVIHSVDPRTDLKENDLRERLIRHAQSPEGGMQDKKRRKAPTSFEFEFQEKIYDHLINLGYGVLVDWPVGSYKLDLVVEGKDGRVAIKCDGEKEFAPQKLDQDIHRETVLERVGWRFIRLRASEFYLDPERALRTLEGRLKELDIEPLTTVDKVIPIGNDGMSELARRVINRASELRRSWKLAEESDEEEGEGDDEVGPLVDQTVKPVAKPAAPPRPEPVTATAPAAQPPAEAAAPAVSLDLGQPFGMLDGMGARAFAPKGAVPYPPTAARPAGDTPAVKPALATEKAVAPADKAPPLLPSLAPKATPPAVPPAAAAAKAGGPAAGAPKPPALNLPPPPPSGGGLNLPPPAPMGGLGGGGGLNLPPPPGGGLGGGGGLNLPPPPGGGLAGGLPPLGGAPLPKPAGNLPLPAAPKTTKLDLKGAEAARPAEDAEGKKPSRLELDKGKQEPASAFAKERPARIDLDT
jgi:very-short-patch-repair endonuclease